MKRLLSVDWDYFFPELSFDPEMWQFYDWGHRDGGSFFLDAMWYHRAATFLVNNFPLPMSTGLETTFWKRFKFTPATKLYYADSHVNIYNDKVRKGIHEVLSFDAHHDAGYSGPKDRSEALQHQIAYMKKGKVSCEDWAIAFKFLHGIDVSVVYPNWKTWAMTGEPTPVVDVPRLVDTDEPVAGKFNSIFVCRSGGWSPSWLDDNFDAFIEACPVKTKINLDGISNRNFDHEVLKREVEQQTKIHAEMVARNAAITKGASQ